MSRRSSELTSAQVRAARVAALLLDSPAPRTPVDVATWCGALQAQDASSGHWSLGVRCAGRTETDILAAFERGEVIRTWPMRGTIHIVPGADISWMLNLTAGRALAVALRRREQLGLTAGDGDRAANVLDQALAGRECRTRAESLAILEDAGIDTSGPRAYHLLSYIAHIGVICIGPQRGSDQTFVRISDWAPKQVQLDRNDALAELFYRFVRSHGPVPLRDFVGWTGLTLGDARAAAAANVGRVESIATESGEMWASHELAATIRADELGAHELLALPGFDEFILGYKDRSLQIPEGAFERIVPGNNGVFRATLVEQGAVFATWKRTVRKSAVAIEVEPFAPMSARKQRAAERAFAPYSHFIGMPVEVQFASP